MMSRVLSQIAQQNTLIVLMTCAGLMIFLSFFVGMLIWVYQRRRHEHFAEMSRMPLEASESLGANPERRIYE